MKLFDLFTNSSEYLNVFPDMFGRQRFFNSRNTEIFKPVISEMIWGRGLRPSYPEGKSFAVAISHDIDKVYEWKSGSAVVSSSIRHLRSGKLRLVANEILNVARKEPYLPFDINKLLDLHGQRSIRSTYYCQAFEKSTPDFNYEIQDILPVLRRIVREGNEIGLHSSPSAIEDPQLLMKEKTRLEGFLSHPVKGNRTHFLKFNLPASWGHLQDAGIEYDATIGYPDIIGFRNGMCYPHRPYDVSARKFLDIIELPLIIMDTSVFVYMRLSMPIFRSLVIEILRKVKSCGGVLTILWHNHYLSGEYERYYVALLDIIKESEPWIAPHSEVIQWWKKQGLLEESQRKIEDLFQEELEGK